MPAGCQAKADQEVIQQTIRVCGTLKSRVRAAIREVLPLLRSAAAAAATSSGPGLTRDHRRYCVASDGSLVVF